MRIDPGSHEPIYLQIVAEVRKSIAAGVYKSGEMLPSLRVLAVDLRVNPNTVQRAYDQLEREGAVVCVPAGVHRRGAGPRQAPPGGGGGGGARVAVVRPEPAPRPRTRRAGGAGLRWARVPRPGGRAGTAGSPGVRAYAGLFYFM